MNKTNTNKIMMIAFVAIIMMMGMGIAVNKAPAMGIAVNKAPVMTNSERFNAGWSSLTASDSHELASDDLPADLKTLWSHWFQHHTDAFKNGFIAALDYYHNLTIPYKAYSFDSDGNAIVSPLSMYNSIKLGDGRH